MRTDVAIEELVLSIPGIAPGDAPSIADDVLRRVHDRLRGVTTRSGNVQLAELHVVLPSGADRTMLIDTLVDRIVEVLR